MQLRYFRDFEYGAATWTVSKSGLSPKPGEHNLCNSLWKGTAREVQLAGDRPDASLDSRYFGPTSHVLGRAKLLTFGDSDPSVATRAQPSALLDRVMIWVEDEMATNSAKQDKEAPDLEECLKTLRSLRNDLQKGGIKHIAIFGSVARHEANKKSDIDIIIETKIGACFDGIDRIALRMKLSKKFGRRVDVISIGGLKSPEHDNIRKEMIPAF
ncbi:MAG TPA: nucleotidyltransferase domain-containing protein [Candidatus Baltobacteraceae bacterium]|jgi:hypothetical protein|nr:nucleotidyltransferase domain-containing protein [Candidatus Baltobacteraceae bacterium]